jgi:hypothetical protein
MQEAMERLKLMVLAALFSATFLGKISETAI